MGRQVQVPSQTTSSDKKDARDEVAAARMHWMGEQNAAVMDRRNKMPLRWMDGGWGSAWAYALLRLHCGHTDVWLMCWHTHPICSSMMVTLTTNQ